MLYKIVLTYQVKRIIKSWPESVQLKLTSLVLKLSFGEVLSASDAKAMTVIATSCRELRVKDPAGQYRAFYLLKQPHGVIIFHAFQKKTQKTPQKEITTAKSRLQSILRGDIRE